MLVKFGKETGSQIRKEQGDVVKKFILKISSLVKRVDDEANKKLCSKK